MKAMNLKQKMGGGEYVGEFESLKGWKEGRIKIIIISKRIKLKKRKFTESLFLWWSFSNICMYNFILIMKDSYEKNS